MKFVVLALLTLLVPQLALAEGFQNLDMTGTERGIYTVLIFLIAYGFVMTEEFTHMRKSKPVIFEDNLFFL